MKKILVLFVAILMVSTQAYSATWTAKDRVCPVGQQILTKNKITAKLTFKVVEGVADNSESAKTKLINISADDLQYAGNDNEVAAVISNELGHIICCHTDKAKLMNYILNGTTNASEIASTTGGEFLSSKIAQKEEEEADITGVNLMITAGYNPLALIVWVTKQPGSAMDILKSRPNNFDRAMTTFKYLSYAYPSKVKAGYNCQEYRTFLASAEPQMKKLTTSKRRLAKFNKEQEKLIQQRQEDLAKYKANGGLNSWGVTYDWLTNTEQAK
jgi:hypothetical protein